MQRATVVSVLLLMLGALGGLATAEAAAPAGTDQALTYGDFAVLLFQTANADTPLKDPKIALGEAQRVGMVPEGWKAADVAERSEVQRVLAEMNVSSQGLGSTTGPVTRGTLEGVLTSQSDEVTEFVTQSQDPRRPWKRLVDDGIYRAVSGSEF